MRMKSIVITFLVLAIVSFGGQNGTVGPAGVDPPPLASGWNRFSWAGGGTPLNIEGAFSLVTSGVTKLIVVDV
jgi:hypothetical protein